MPSLLVTHSQKVYSATTGKFPKVRKRRNWHSGNRGTPTDFEKRMKLGRVSKGKHPAQKPKEKA